MTRIQLRIGPNVLISAALSAGIILLMLLLSGCAANETYDSGYAAQSKQRDDFQYGVNRPPTAQTLYSMAKLLIAQDKDPEAVYVLTRINREHPDFMPAYVELAEIHLRHRRVTEAEAVLQAGHARQPENALLLNNLGMCAMLRSDYDAAADYFNRAMELSPRDGRYIANLALARGMLGDYDKSLTLYHRVVSPAEAHYNLAVVCEAREDHDAAREHHARAKALGRR